MDECQWPLEATGTGQPASCGALSWGSKRPGLAGPLREQQVCRELGGGREAGLHAAQSLSPNTGAPGRRRCSLGLAVQGPGPQHRPHTCHRPRPGPTRPHLTLLTTCSAARLRGRGLLSTTKSQRPPATWGSLCLELGGHPTDPCPLRGRPASLGLQPSPGPAWSAHKQERRPVAEGSLPRPGSCAQRARCCRGHLSGCLQGPPKSASRNGTRGVKPKLFLTRENR